MTAWIIVKEKSFGDLAACEGVARHLDKSPVVLTNQDIEKYGSILDLIDHNPQLKDPD